jgi:hypothetical protein
LTIVLVRFLSLPPLSSNSHHKDKKAQMESNTGPLNRVASWELFQLRTQISLLSIKHQVLSLSLSLSLRSIEQTQSLILYW